MTNKLKCPPLVLYLVILTIALLLRRKLQHRQSPGYATDGEVGGGQLLKMTSAYYVKKAFPKDKVS